MTLSLQQSRALISVEQRMRLEVRDRLVAYATTYWGGMGSWRDADVDRFVERVVPQVVAGRRTAAQITDAYLARMLESDGVGLVDVEDIRGLSDSEVYRRPAVQMRTELSKGATFQAAQAAALARLANIVKTDLQLASTRQARRNMRRSSVKMFQRTLTGAENCALCTIASTQRYYKEDLLPIHPGCDCGVAPWRGEDVQVINEELLEQVHSEVQRFVGESDRGARFIDGENPLSDYMDLVVSREHGELGPTLSWREDKFTGPSDF